MLKVSNPFSNIPPLFSDLAKILAGEIECSQVKLEEYSKDGSPYSVKPQAIIYPKSATDIKHIISFAREYSIPIAVRGNGTARTGGSLSEGIVIDMARYFTHIRQMNLMDHTVTVDAGVSIRELREKLKSWKMDIPLLTSQDDDATIGALVATKSVTPTSFHFSTIREWVEALTLIVDTGEEHRLADGITPSGRLLGIYQAIFPILTQSGPLLRAAKPETNDDATGYCLWNTSIGPRQLLDQVVGSEGTLGIITTVTLRLVPHTEHTSTVYIPILDKEHIATYIQYAKKYHAYHMFMYDSTFMELTERYQANSAPNFPEASYSLCISFSANTQEEAKTSTKKFLKSIKQEEKDVTIHDSNHSLEQITNPSFLFSLLHSYTQGSHIPITVCGGIIVAMDDYANLLEEIENYLYSTGKLYVITGNVGSGHICITTLFDPQSRIYEQEMDTYTQAIFSYVKKYKGGISAQSGEGLARTPYIPFMYNEATIAIFNAIKKAWDPLSILNPGKKLGASLTYLHNHLSRSDNRG
jgi:FAD/FMN-containing dehydrogenase